MGARFKKILISGWTAVNVAVSAAVIISGYGGTVSPDISVIPSMALMVFPLCVAAAVALIAIDLLTKRRLALIPAVAVALCAGPLWNFCPIHLSSPEIPDGHRQLRILSYNVYGMVDYAKQEAGIPYRKDSVRSTLSYIIADNPDIAFLQESSLLSQMKFQFPLQYDSLARMYPYRVDTKTAHVILSKFPFDTIAVTQPRSQSASVLCARFDIDGFQLTAMSVHLQSIGLSTDDKELYTEMSEGHARHNLRRARNQLLPKLAHAFRQRASQARLIRHEIDSLKPANMIVVGDFNDISGCYAMRVIEGSDMTDVYSHVGCGPLITYHAHRFYFHIDHVLYGGDLTPLSFHRGSLRSSDHYPVTATFAIPADK